MRLAFYFFFLCFAVIVTNGLTLSEVRDDFGEDWKKRYSELKIEFDSLTNRLNQEEVKVSNLLMRFEEESSNMHEVYGHLEEKQIENSELITLIEKLERKSADETLSLEKQVNELKTQLDAKSRSGMFSNEIMFMASSRPTEVVHYPNDYITFEELELDNGGVFTKETGTFVAPTEGKYLFYFISEVEDCPETFIRIYVNGKITQYFRHNNGAGYDGREINAFWWLNLQAGDEVRLFNEIEGCMYIKKYYPMYFMGYRVNDDSSV